MDMRRRLIAAGSVADRSTVMDVAERIAKAVYSLIDLPAQAQQALDLIRTGELLFYDLLICRAAGMCVFFISGAMSGSRH